MLLEGELATLSVMSAYIDLNPVRAGLVQDPKDYRWCSYAEAVAGGRKALSALYTITNEHRLQEQNQSGGSQRIPSAAKVLSGYRVWLFGQGEEVRDGHGSDSRVLRKGIKRDGFGIVCLCNFQRGPDMGGGVGGMMYSLRNGGTEAKFAMSNGRGDVVAQSNDAGALTWTASYEAYGKRPVETGTNLDRQRANTKEEDPTGLLNEGFRYRDIETGVWLSRDPAGFVDGPNVYAYVRQNPWTSFDPEGLKTISNYLEDRSVAKGRMAEIENDRGFAFNSKRYSEWDGLRSDVALYESKIGDIMSTAKAMAHYTGAAVDAELLDDDWSTYKDFNRLHFWHSMNPEAEVGDRINKGDYSGAGLKFTQDAVVALLAEAGGRVALRGASRFLGYADDVASNSAAPAFRTWNQFQSGTAGQFATRAEAGAAWSVYKEANGIVTGTTRSTAARSKFLRGMAESGKSPSWMNQWLRQGKVPPGYHVDHIKPLSIGGPDIPANMRLLDIDLHKLHHHYYRPWDQ